MEIENETESDYSSEEEKIKSKIAKVSKHGKVNNISKNEEDSDQSNNFSDLSSSSGDEIEIKK